MAIITFDSIRRHLRCPYEYMMDRRSPAWRITSEECMDMAVRDAVLASEQRRVMHGERISRDDAMSLFWESWDRHFPDVGPQQDGARGLLRYGERCMDMYLSVCGRYDVRQVSAVGVQGTLPLPNGDEVLAVADILMVRGPSATVCRYVTDSGPRSSDELASDPEMLLAAKWVLDNVSGCRAVRMRWEFLSSGTSVEATAAVPAIARALEQAADAAAAMSSGQEPLPRETAHCLRCPYLAVCPRKLHENTLRGDPAAMSRDEGVALVDRYADLQEKIDALKRRQQELEARRDGVAAEIVAFADANGFMAVSGHGCKALVRHERKVELPEDKTEVIRALRDTGTYDELSMPNYPRLRSDIAKGAAPPEVARLATVTPVDRVYLRRTSRRRRHAVFYRK